jgi:hypothetical protein
VKVLVTGCLTLLEDKCRSHEVCCLYGCFVYHILSYCCGYVFLLLCLYFLIVMCVLFCVFCFIVLLLLQLKSISYRITFRLGAMRIVVVGFVCIEPTAIWRVSQNDHQSQLLVLRRFKNVLKGKLQTHFVGYLQNCCNRIYRPRHLKYRQYVPSGPCEMCSVYI